MSLNGQNKIIVRRHLNKLRWIVLLTVFSMLVLLPYISVYQNYNAAHAYDLLSGSEKTIYDIMETITAPFVSDPANDLDAIKGTTWSGNFFGLKISDPLAVVGQVSAGLTVYTPFLITALIPVVLTIIFGRFFCGWICPATLIYELNDVVRRQLLKVGIPLGNISPNRKLKYVILGSGIIFCMITGTVAFAAIYPPAIIGRELYFSIALKGFGIGIVFFVFTLLLDILVTRRFVCRYLCPGGALYSLLGHFRLLRIQRDVATCNDCEKCNVVCEFGLDPLRDGFGQECNNCTACMAVCPTDALVFKLSLKDTPDQGAGHLSHEYRHQHGSSAGGE